MSILESESGLEYGSLHEALVAEVSSKKAITEKQKKIGLGFIAPDFLAKKIQALLEIYKKPGGPAETTEGAQEKTELSDAIDQIVEEEMPAIVAATTTIEDKLLRRQAEKEMFKAQSLTQEALLKVSEQLGSNPGGWYEEKETGQRYYMKFYADQNRAKVELIANAIYERLGIPVAQTKLVEVDGKMALASQEIVGATRTTAAEQRESSDVRRGFVADAFLANWDVVGLSHDNIVQSEGKYFRIDNGGSLVYRAQGAPKTLATDSVPELKTMRNPDYPAGEVFGDLTEQEIAIQARDLVTQLTKYDIAAIVDLANLPPEMAEQVREGLIARRAALVKHFHLESDDQQRPYMRIPIALEILEQEEKKFQNLEFFPRVSFLADSHHIENQEVDVIHNKDTHERIVQFKLTETAKEAVMNSIRQRTENSKMGYTHGQIIYSRQSEDNQSRYVLSSSYNRRLQSDVVIQVSSARNVHLEEVRAAEGLVQITIPDAVPVEDTGVLVDRILREELQIPNGIEEPESEAVLEYKKRRYLWHHKLKDESMIPPGTLERLQRQEVFPQYHTFVEPGKHKEYEQIGEFCIMHNIHGEDQIANILKSGGLFSTHERFRRGLEIHGMSSIRDLLTGGGDNVFTRIYTKACAEEQLNLDETSPETMIIFEHELLDRTDWYLYGHDQYGTTDPIQFSKRIAPTRFFEGQQGAWNFHPSNEQMFRVGISVEQMKCIVVDIDRREHVLTTLRDAGIEQINNKPIEEFIVSPKTLREAYALGGMTFPEKAKKEEPSGIQWNDTSPTPPSELNEDEVQATQTIVGPGDGQPEDDMNDSMDDLWGDPFSDSY